MVAGNKIIASILAVYAVTASVHADMMPASLVSSGHQPVGVYDRADDRGAGPWDIPTASGPEMGPVVFLPPADSDENTATQAQTPQVLNDNQGSLDLCLYALFGLGLCRSVPVVRKLSFGCIPDWYHHGGPFQIGHSYAIGPDCLHCVVACFVQPDGPMTDVIPHCYQGPIAALLRKSLFTPTVLASRGPPRMS